MPIEVRDSGVDKTVQQCFAQDSGTDKEVQEIIVNDNGTDKTVFTASSPTLPESFETPFAVLPDGWAMNGGSDSDVVGDTGYSTDGSSSVQIQAKQANATVGIEKDFDLSGVSSISVDAKSQNFASNGPGELFFRALDQSGNIVDLHEIPSFSGETTTLTLYISSLNTSTAVTVLLAVILLGSGEVHDASFDFLRET